MSTKATKKAGSDKGQSSMSYGNSIERQTILDGKKVIGTTIEGINILRPAGNPSNFSWQQLREVVAGVLGNPGR